MVPVERRLEILAAYDRGEGSMRELARRFGVNWTSIQRWRNRLKATGSVEPSRAPRGRKPLLGPVEHQVLRELLAADPTLDSVRLAERLAEQTGKRVSPNALRRTLHRMGLRFIRARNPHARPDVAAPGAPAPAATAAPPVAAASSGDRYRAVHRESPTPTQTRRAYPSDLSDAEWEQLRPLLVPAGSRGRPRKYPLREQVNAVRYLVRSGCSWRMLPHDFPPWNTVAKTYYTWVDSDIWASVNDTLREELRIQAERNPQPSASIVDSQSVKTTEKGGSAALMPARKPKVESGISS